MSQIYCNILVVGKSGAGKSSFCNYLFDKPSYFETGQGKPVTGWDNNFQSYTFHMDDMPIVVYDSVGLEPNNFTMWNTQLNDFLSKHSTSQKDPTLWIHGVFYVMNACSDRVEDLEKKLIKEVFLTQASLPVQVILTNCDTAGEVKINAMAAQIRELSKNVSIHQVNSVTARYRTKSSAAFGREAVLEPFLSHSYKYVGKKVAQKSIDEIEAFLRQIKDSLQREIDRSNISVFTLSKLESFDLDSLLPSDEDLEERFKDLVLYEEFMSSFNVKYQGENELHNILEVLSTSLNHFSPSVLTQLEKSLHDLEHGNLIEKMSGAISLAVSVLTIKRTIKEAINQMFDQVLPLKDNAQLLTVLPVQELLNIMTVSQKRKRMLPWMWACWNRLTGCIPNSTWSLYQSMSWMRSHPAFFVRCAETVPYPCCGEALRIIGSRKRKLTSESGESRVLVVRRLRCSGCRSIHHELPDCIVPYKRYESACIEQVVSEPESSSVAAADDATLRRWKNWFQGLCTYWLGCLTSIATRVHQNPVEKPSVPPQSAHQRIGHYVGDASGWLARIVRPVVNSNLWVHTRSAFLST